MIAIRKKYIAWAGWAVLAVILLTGATVGLAQVTDAEEPELVPVVTIETVPLKVDDSVYIEADGVPGHTPAELVGVFDVYDGNGEITFSWTPYAFAAGANGAYRISLLQLLNPLAEEQEWAERKVAHHHADSPTTFTYGAFGFGEEICETCPTYIIVWAETYTLDALGAPVYSPIAGLYSPIAISTDASIQASEPFVIEILRPDPAPEEEPVKTPAVPTCQAGTQGGASGDWVLTGAGCECGGDTLTGSAFGSSFCGGSTQGVNWDTEGGYCVCIAP